MRFALYKEFGVFNIGPVKHSDLYAEVRHLGQRVLEIACVIIFSGIGIDC